ncbi:hypothetical protein GCM10009613_29600 [Pseudonocardia kongjuensis]|uniref:DUF485 domain-containing protein n=2 Tax=Pseudonocardia kongjuensis TaxID=102227 RepID=A0ABN1XTY0_9PSEU
MPPAMTPTPLPVTGSPQRGDVATGPDVWTAAARSPEFAELRSRQRRFLIPATAGFLSWFFLFIALNAWAPGLLGTRVLGDLTLVVLLAIGQFASTFAITAAYVRYADRRLDPLADEIRERLEGIRR